MMVASEMTMNSSSQYQPRGQLRTNESLARHTSWRTGGTADQYFIPLDRQDLCQFLKQLEPSVPITWIGLGSNVLVRDGGVRGVVIATQKGITDLKSAGSNRLFVEAGVTGAKLARFSVRSGLIGAEFFVGIPGTFGGALAMNAGAFGHETWDVVDRVETINRSGQIQITSAKEFEVGYRQVELPENCWFLSGELLLKPGSGKLGQARIRELLTTRAESQPIQSYNAGSVFRNPAGDYAARLIEDSGLKGCRFGGAVVSEKHANFIINQDQASASDIEQLINQVQRSVKRQQGVNLKTEVRIIGESL